MSPEPPEFAYVVRAALEASAVQFSACGRLAWDGERLFNTETGSTLTHIGTIERLCFSPDFRWFAAVVDGKLLLYNTTRALAGGGLVHVNEELLTVDEIVFGDCGTLFVLGDNGDYFCIMAGVLSPAGTLTLSEIGASDYNLEASILDGFLCVYDSVYTPLGVKVAEYSEALTPVTSVLCLNDLGAAFCDWDGHVVHQCDAAGSLRSIFANRNVAPDVLRQILDQLGVGYDGRGLVFEEGFCVPWGPVAALLEDEELVQFSKAHTPFRPREIRIGAYRYDALPRAVSPSGAYCVYGADSLYCLRDAAGHLLVPMTPEVPAFSPCERFVAIQDEDEDELRVFRLGNLSRPLFAAEGGSSPHYMGDGTLLFMTWDHLHALSPRFADTVLCCSSEGAPCVEMLGRVYAGSVLTRDGVEIAAFKGLPLDPEHALVDGRIGAQGTKDGEDALESIFRHSCHLDAAVLRDFLALQLPSASWGPDGLCLQLKEGISVTLLWPPISALLADGEAFLARAKAALAPVPTAVINGACTPFGFALRCDEVVVHPRGLLMEANGLVRTPVGRALLLTGGGRVAFSPCGTWFVASTEDNYLAVWAVSDLLKGRKRPRWTDKAYESPDVTFVGDRLYASLHFEGSSRIFEGEIRKGACVLTRVCQAHWAVPTPLGDSVLVGSRLLTRSGIVHVETKEVPLTEDLWTDGEELLTATGTVGRLQHEMPALCNMRTFPALSAGTLRDVLAAALPGCHVDASGLCLPCRHGEVAVLLPFLSKLLPAAQRFPYALECAFTPAVAAHFGATVSDFADLIDLLLDSHAGLTEGLRELENDICEVRALPRPQQLAATHQARLFPSSSAPLQAPVPGAVLGRIQAADRLIFRGDSCQSAQTVQGLICAAGKEVCGHPVSSLGCDRGWGLCLIDHDMSRLQNLLDAGDLWWPDLVSESSEPSFEEYEWEVDSFDNLDNYSGSDPFF